MAGNYMVQCINIGLLVFIFRIYFSHTVAVALTSCYSDEFRQVADNGTAVCIPCTICPPGQGATEQCTIHRDTKCENCTYNETFSSLPSSFQGCVPCGTCDNAEVTAPCTPTRNINCGRCLPGYFRDTLLMRCRECAYCYPGLSTRISECSVSGVNRNFQCSPLLFPPAVLPTQPLVSRSSRNSQRRKTSRRSRHRNRELTINKRSISRNR